MTSEGKVNVTNAIESKKASSKEANNALSKHDRTLEDGDLIQAQMKARHTIPLSIPEELLIEKSKKWKQLNNKRFAEKRKHGFIHGAKEKLPPEVLRYL